MQEKGKKAMEKGSLEEAYDLYTSYLTKLDKHLAPPYPDYYRIQQSIWKCIWMRFGNRVVRAKAVKPAVTADDYDTVDQTSLISNKEKLSYKNYYAQVTDKYI